MWVCCWFQIQCVFKVLFACGWHALLDWLVLCKPSMNHFEESNGTIFLKLRKLLKRMLKTTTTTRRLQCPWNTKHGTKTKKKTHELVLMVQPKAKINMAIETFMKVKSLCNNTWNALITLCAITQFKSWIIVVILKCIRFSHHYEYQRSTMILEATSSFKGHSKGDGNCTSAEQSWGLNVQAWKKIHGEHVRFEFTFKNQPITI